MDIEQLFNTGLEKYHITNTAYPPDKKNWLEYDNTPDFSFWGSEEGLGLYVHIPFCESRCLFCEYVTMERCSDELVNRYLDTLLLELKLYRERVEMPGKMLYGLDIGGGTPTTLSEKEMDKLLSGLKPVADKMSRSEDYEQSIETTPQIASSNYSMLKLLTDHGFTRISMGIQTTDHKVLENCSRQSPADGIYNKSMENFRKAGFIKINLDIMYGLPGESDRSWQRTLDFTVSLSPDQVSVYETRYKDSGLPGHHKCEEREKMIYRYEQAYNFFSSEGYYGHYGSSAFTRNREDGGLSTYLKRRTTDFISYMGLGIGSQSMTGKHLSYNFGKNSYDLISYIRNTENGNPIEYFYKLPLDEALGKYISISFYLGYINYHLLNRHLKINFLEYYDNEIKFLLERNFIRVDDKKITFTKAGYSNYHGIIPLFYSGKIKKYLLKADLISAGRTE